MLFRSGVLHAAGVLQDRLIRSMSASDFGNVFAPKANGAALLYGATAQLPLQASVLFASIASAFGNIGQANYASSNAYLDALAPSRRTAGQRALSLQLPMVLGAGMGQATIESASSSEAQAKLLWSVGLDSYAHAMSWLCASLPGRMIGTQVLLPVALEASMRGAATSQAETVAAAACG